MTEDEIRTKLFNLRYQQRILQMHSLHEEDEEVKKAFLEELTNVQNELKIVRKQIARMKMEKLMEEKQGGMKR